MIKFGEGELLDLLSYPVSLEPEVVALSYALRMGMARLLTIMPYSAMYSAIDMQPEEVLDYMAAELRLDYYRESMSIDTKRELVKNGLRYRKNAGTKAAVKELVESIFGSGDVIEWMDIDGANPGEFEVVTPERFTPETFNMLDKTIQSVKNASSHLRSVRTQRKISVKHVIAAGAELIRHRVIGDATMKN